MTAFMDYYVVKVERFLKRNLTQNEISLSKEKYILGWHPARTAEFLKQIMWQEGFPEIEGWYAIQYCWDVEEGIFYGADYFDGKRWLCNYPVGRFAGNFENEFEAEEFSKSEDPEAR